MNPSEASDQALEEALDRADEGGQSVAVLINYNVHPEKIAEWWVSPLNRDTMGEVTKKTTEGWIPIRVQTEFYIGIGGGHQTMIYMVKLKSASGE